MYNIYIYIYTEVIKLDRYSVNHSYHFQKNIYEHELENHKFPHNDKYVPNFVLLNIFLMLMLL